MTDPSTPTLKKLHCNRGDFVDWLRPYMTDPGSYMLAVTTEVIDMFMADANMWPGVTRLQSELFGIKTYQLPMITDAAVIRVHQAGGTLVDMAELVDYQPRTLN